MTTYTLTQIDVSGIQPFIFGSNNLKQNIGASELVAQVTEAWVLEALATLQLTHNIRKDADGALHLAAWAADGRESTRVIYWGGGNALILFAGAPEQHAIPFTAKLTRLALARARGLGVVIDHVALEWESDILARKHVELRQRVAARKLDRPHSVPQLGLGVTAACVYTGLPAVAVDQDGALISEVVRQKYAAQADGEARVGRLLASVAGGYAFASDFNALGERDESSYIAVIHADGNKMGKRFEAIANAYKDAPAQNDAYCAKLRQFSQAVNSTAEKALKETVSRLLASVDAHSGKFGDVVPFPENDAGDKVLPFRPIVFGGDDVTFVSEGRLGIALAAYYLRRLAEAGPLPGATENEAGDPLYARAGIAVVKAHYPFSRAYELAGELAKSAKDSISKLTPENKGIALDWHFATSGAILPLEQLRRREYRSAIGNNMLMRPLRLDVGAPPVGSKYWRSWDNFVAVTTEFQQSDCWYQHRNKIKALREPLREGAEAVKYFRELYDLPPLPDIPGQAMQETGWHSEDCGYFDAIEALDFFVNLTPAQTKEEATA